MRGANLRDSSGATAEAERVVAWLRLPAIGLIALGQTIAHPNPQGTAFALMLAAFAAWSAAVLGWVYLRPAGPRLALAVTAVDIAAISVLAVLSGGAFSNARLALFLVPVAVAFRFQPRVTGAATLVVVVAYLAQSVAHPSVGQPEAVRFIVEQAGFLAWVGIACVFLSAQLARRTALVASLGDARSRLLTEVQSVELRERRALAESLHDEAIQNLLSARHDLEDARSGDEAGEALARADAAVADTVTRLREAVFELHPHVLDQIGLEAALHSVAQQAADRGGLALRLDLRYPHQHDEDHLLFAAARELLANVVRHAGATTVSLRLVDEGGYATLLVEDDGTGFPEESSVDRLAQGHVGLATQRLRVEATGGTMVVASAPGSGTRVVIRIPLSAGAAVAVV